jgi:ribose transport system substrate-binding protein
VVEIWGLKGSSAAQERHQGFHDIIGKSPNIHVVVEQDGAWLRSNAREVMETALKAHEKIDLVYAHNDPMAVGAYLAAKDAGRAQGMRFVGIDGNPGVEGGAQAVLDGTLTATFLYQTPGGEGIRQARKVLRGETVPKRILLATATITKDNAKKYASR